MPRRPRIELSGFHHVINRGVNKSDIYKSDEDYEMFLVIVCKACKNYRVTLHDYCLMHNHFHLLVECELENISLLIKHINSNYAIYFNKKYKRSGHLWQGRFYSRYVNSDEYFYTLVKYIESNPVEAQMAEKIGDYPYTLLSAVKNRTTIVQCALNSKLIDEIEDIDGFMGISLNENDLKILQRIKNQKVMVKENKQSVAYSKTLKHHFRNSKTMSSRDKAIKEALNDGYTQAQISRYLEVSRALISMIVKKF